MGYTYLPRDDSSIESFHGVFLKIRRALGTTAFGINEIRLPPGADGREHDESDTGHDEVYAVIAGSGVFTVDGDRLDVAAGDYLLVDATSTRLVTAGDDGLTFIVVAGKPLPAYDGRESL